MTRQRRRELIEALEKARSGRLVIAYITSTRQNVEVPIADDVLRLVFEHLQKGSKRAKTGVDLFLHSNGGSGTTPWRLVNLIREYTENFAVLVPHKAFSAATLTALGADTIVMHRMGCLGPIDPSVGNAFNPTNPSDGRFLPISVEDVSAYFKLVKEDVQINHEDELIQAFKALSDRVHPLALGNVQRSHHQSRMMARKLLLKHMAASTSEHEINQIIDNLKSNLFFHGHPINRSEAKEDLKLEVEFADESLEKLMWDLYCEYESSMPMEEPFQASHELEIALAAQPAPAATPPPTTADLVQQIMQMAQAGIGFASGLPTQTVVDIAAAMLPHVSGSAAASRAKPARLTVTGAYVESTEWADVFRTDLTLERTMNASPSGPQPAIRQELIWQRWEQEK